MIPDLRSYDKIIVAYSGGKDSTACLLHLLERGVPKSRIELWHHDVDGRADRFMDWPVTPSYCTAVSKALGIPLYFSWRRGGFLREMLRHNSPTAPVTFETPHVVISAGGNGPLGTRLKFPQLAADLSIRWCSAYLKVDVARRVFARDPRFSRGRYLLITGERAEESASRARYKELEPHASTNHRRRVEQWRPVLAWPEERVWEIIRRALIRPHPAYFLGWGRVSCLMCIFGDPNQWASAKEIDPEAFERIASYERRFGLTIRKGRTVHQVAALGDSFLPDDPKLKKIALYGKYLESWVIVDRKLWKLPSGAFKKAGGPT